jgi:hypothetical protein
MNRTTPEVNSSNLREFNGGDVEVCSSLLEILLRSYLINKNTKILAKKSFLYNLYQG